MTPLEMIAEWSNGCSCAVIGSPEQCHECTKELIDSLEWKLSEEDETEKDAKRYQWLRMQSRIAYAKIDAMIGTPLIKGTPFLEFPNSIVANDPRSGQQFRQNFNEAVDMAMRENFHG